MKIGITEQGDAGLDLSWVKKLSNVDAAILITKNLTRNAWMPLCRHTKTVTDSSCM